MRCDECKWWQPIRDQQNLGACLRFPPPDAGEKTGRPDSYPTVQSNSCCGEYVENKSGDSPAAGLWELATESKTPAEMLDKAKDITRELGGEVPFACNHCRHLYNEITGIWVAINTIHEGMRDLRTAQ